MADTTPKTKEELSDKYGFALSVITSNDELNQLFQKAWDALKSGKEWSDNEFQIAVKKSTWYRTKSASERNYETLKNDTQQTEEFNRQIAKQKATVSRLASIAGASLSDTALDEFANNSLKYGWNEAEIEKSLNGYIAFTGGSGSLTGNAGDYEDQIRKYAGQMGIDIPDTFVQTEVGKAMNSKSIQSAQDWIRNRAKEKYSPWAADLDANPETTIEDLSYNYRKSMSDLFEIGLDEVKMNDTVMRGIMEGDGSGQKKTAWQFEQDLRKDPRWAKTKNARESTQSVVNDILSTFGLM